MAGALQAAPDVSLLDGLVLAQLLASCVVLARIRDEDAPPVALLLGGVALASALALLAFDRLVLAPAALTVLRWPAAALFAGGFAALGPGWLQGRRPLVFTGTSDALVWPVLLGNGVLVALAALAEYDAQGPFAALQWAAAAALAQAVVLLLFLALRARLLQADLPAALRGLPIALLAAAIAALGLLGLRGVGFA
jgi:electron transport complex protein RnfA